MYNSPFLIRCEYAAVPTHFSGAVPDDELIKDIVKLLGRHGFHSESSVNLVSTCKDAICKDFTRKVERLSGKTADISALAGFSFCGRTGLKIAVASAPVVAGRQQYVFWVAPHIGSGDCGAARILEPSARQHSHCTCSALNLIHNELKKGRFVATLDPQDIELSLVRQQLATGLSWGAVPSLVALTRHAYSAALDSVRQLAAAAIDTTKCDYAIVAGVLINGTDGQDRFWPGAQPTHLISAKKCASFLEIMYGPHNHVGLIWGDERRLDPEGFVRGGVGPAPGVRGGGRGQPNTASPTPPRERLRRGDGGGRHRPRHPHPHGPAPRRGPGRRRAGRCLLGPGRAAGLPEPRPDVALPARGPVLPAPGRRALRRDAAARSRPQAGGRVPGGRRCVTGRSGPATVLVAGMTPAALRE